MQTIEFITTYSAGSLSVPPTLRDRLTEGVKGHVVIVVEDNLDETDEKDAEAALLRIVKQIQQTPSPEDAITPASKKMTKEDLERLLAMEPDEPFEQAAYDAYWGEFERVEKQQQRLDEIKTLNQMRDDFLSFGQ